MTSVLESWSADMNNFSCDIIYYNRLASLRTHVSRRSVRRINVVVGGEALVVLNGILDLLGRPPLLLHLIRPLLGRLVAREFPGLFAGGYPPVVLVGGGGGLDPAPSPAGKAISSAHPESALHTRYKSACQLHTPHIMRASQLQLGQAIPAPQTGL